MNNRPDPDKQPGMNSGNKMKNTLILVALVVVAVVIFSTVFPLSGQPEEVPISQAITMAQNGEITKIEVDGEQLTITTIDGREILAYKEPMATVYEIEGLIPAGSNIEVEIKGDTFNWGNLLINIFPLLIFGVLLYYLFRSARGANSQALRFGRSKARLFPSNKPMVTFNDVAGVEEAKQELVEVVDFLKSREKFQMLGARIPKGVLLVGSPGTGKTLLARAVAGEAEVPFFSISGSEFVEMFVGVGASRVRDLFEQAKRNAPCIVFVDEIDAVGRHRGAGLGGGHDEREQTLNQILVEMDGFDTSTTVIVLAATNRPDILDPALLRPGRFDRRVILDLPDINGRAAILKVHIKGKPLADGVDIETLAKQTVGFSGADLANLVNEAAILAARRGKSEIEMSELEESIDRVQVGPERKSRKINPREKSVIAYHEAGHALVAKMLPNADPVHKISIIARGMSLGHTRLLPIEDHVLYSRSQIKDMLAHLLGGHTAEQLIFNEVTNGASDDIQRATSLARRMVTEFGMSETLGPRTFGNKQEMVFLGREISEQRDYGDEVADAIDQEVTKIIEEAENTARSILTENRERLELISETLISRETLEGEDLEKLLDGEPLAEMEKKPDNTAQPEVIEGSEDKQKADSESAPVINPDLNDQLATE